jgi:(p)ppGpp synthase/HD superfamily hydrolase
MTQPGPSPIRAKVFAEKAHRNQDYDNKYPYPYHLEQVVKMLEKFGFDDPVIICAGWLHDCIEDTPNSYGDIKQEFGEEVAELVFAVTNEKGRNRKARNEKTYPGIRGNERATALKLADRIANVEHGTINGGKDDMYRKEFPEFEKALRVFPEVPELTRMWKHLGRLLGVEISKQPE